MTNVYKSTKIVPLGSCAFRQWRAKSHCNKLHGYRLKAKFIISCRNLDDKNWCYDFGAFKELKKILENQFDHTTCIAVDDPEIELFKLLHNKGVIDLRIVPGVGIEKAAQYCFEVADNYIRKNSNGRCWIDSVEVWEHEDNSATYTEYKDLPSADDHADLDIPYPAEDKETTPYEVKFEVKPEVAAKPEFVKAPPLNLAASPGYKDLFKGTSWGNKR